MKTFRELLEIEKSKQTLDEDLVSQKVQQLLDEARKSGWCLLCNCDARHQDRSCVKMKWAAQKAEDEESIVFILKHVEKQNLLTSFKRRTDLFRSW